MSRASWASYDAYLFDLDGTLVDTAPDINAALNNCLQQAGLPTVDESLTRHWVGHGSRVLITQALQHHQDTETPAETEVDALHGPFLEYYSAHLAELSVVYPTVLDTLHSMKDNGARLAVVTNKLAQLSVPLLQQIGLHDLFDLIVCGDTAAAPKPDPAPVHYCLDAFQLQPASALFIGDSAADVDAARAANVAVVCVRDGYNHGVDVTTMPVDGVIDTFAELLA